jgi:hypothetical protein
VVCGIFITLWEPSSRKRYASAVAEKPPASSRMRPRSHVMSETAWEKRRARG